MSVGIFTDKKHRPTMGQMFEAIDPQQSTWKELTQFIQANYPSQQDFRFYGKNYGWALRFRKGGKALLSLYPTEGGFTIQVILGAPDTEKALSLKLGKHVRQIIEQAHPYPEGRWLFIAVKSERDIKDVQQLLALKCGTNRQQKRRAAGSVKSPKPAKGKNGKAV
jgi:Protein of unknown function (DUF3788)